MTDRKENTTEINEHILSIESCVFKWEAERETRMKDSQNNQEVQVGMLGMRQVLEMCHHNWHLDMTFMSCQLGINATRPLGLEVICCRPVSPY